LAVRIRFARTGRTNRPYFRLGAFDSRTRRDGPPIEYLGHYDPLVKEFDKGVEIDLDRVRHWLGHGAKVTETVASFLKRKGVVLPRNARTSGRKSKGKAPGSGKKAGRAQKGS
jgi:small subunit ribosomal protein S16